MKPVQLLPISFDDAVRVLREGSAEDAARAVLRVALFERDRRRAEALCLRAIDAQNPALVRAGITGLGHIVRVHARLSPWSIGVVASLAEDTTFPLRAIATGALGEIATHCRAGCDA